MTIKIKSRLIRLAVSGMLLSIACAALGCLVVSWDSPMQKENEKASIAISRDICGATSVESPSANELVLGSCEAKISYTFDAARQTLTRTASSKSEKLLTHLDAFSFALLRVDPHSVKGSLAPTSASCARAVACTWSYSWKLAGAKLDSNQIHLAALHLRNR